MKKIGLEVIKKIHEYGYIGYIVGGFVRDSLLNIESKDIDITTNATPMELKNIFEDIEIVNDTYGAVILHYKGYHFDITTFRAETDYLDNRHPNSVIYVNDLKTDLLRRDFTINALCFDLDGKLIDLVNGMDDLNKHFIRTIGDSNKSFQDDALRILRAIRFASYLDFTLSDDIVKAIELNKYLLKNISYSQKKKELDKIFGSSKAKKGIRLIKKYHLEEVLELNHLDRIKDYSDIMGIWAMINTMAYPFSNSEKELIKNINIVYELDNLNSEVLYQYGLYVNVLAGINKGLDKCSILKQYDMLKIKKRNEIDISALEICQLFKKKPGSFLSEVYTDLEKQIINNQLDNKKEEIERYLLEKYHL